jgi:hypothetical protein
MADLRIHRIVVSFPESFGRDENRLLLPSFSIAKSTLVYIEEEFTRDQRDAFLNQLEIVIQKLPRDLQSHFLLRRENCYTDEIGVPSWK